MVEEEASSRLGEPEETAVTGFDISESYCISSLAAYLLKERDLVEGILNSFMTDQKFHNFGALTFLNCVKSRSPIAGFLG